MNPTNSIQLTFTPKSERPLAITVICLLGFVGAALSVPMVFSEVAFGIGSWFPPYAGMVALSSLVCMLGLWFMQRWAVYAYVGLVFFNQGYLTQQGEWNALLLIPQGLIMVLALAYVDPYARALARQLVRWLKHQLWGLTVAYMVGIHNFWKEDDTTPDEIGLQDEVIEVQRDTGDKD